MLREPYVAISRVIQWGFIGMIRSYRFWISPFLGNCCRFYPSCSHYAETAIRRFGPFKGVWLLLGRLVRCHPFHPGGVDPVPKKRDRSIWT